MRDSLHIETAAPVEFADVVETALASAETIHTHLLSAARAFAVGPEHPEIRRWLAKRAGEFAGAALLGPGGGLEFAGDAADAGEWARVVAATKLRWVAGPIEPIVALLHALGGQWAMPAATEILARHASPPMIPAMLGAFGIATAAECTRLAQWVAAFLAETGLPPVDRLDAAVAGMIARGDAYVWRVDGEPVSMIAVVARTRRTVRCSLVYTPPALRRRGYARDCTGEATRTLLAEGWATCCVHVRVEDEAAKSLYASLGYHQMGLRVEVSCAP